MKNKGTFKNFLKRLVKNNRFLYQIAIVLLRKKPFINALKKKIQGRKNRVAFPGTVIFANCAIDIIGDNNRISIGDYCLFNDTTFLIRGDNNQINISNGVRFNHGGSLHMEDNGCIISIRANSTFEETHIAVLESGSQVVIGEDCMFAYDIDVRTGDSHSIIDTKTGRRINYAKDIRIGDHVWIGAHCSILKGVEVKNNCIVATRSVVTKGFDQEGVIIGGSPSRILKENITWDRKRISKPEQKDREASLMTHTVGVRTSQVHPLQNMGN
jgi:acetyltransferase-like isoleucine patch superfamily enzyme